MHSPGAVNIPGSKLYWKSNSREWFKIQRKVFFFFYILNSLPDDTASDLFRFQHMQFKSIQKQLLATCKTLSWFCRYFNKHATKTLFIVSIIDPIDRSLCRLMNWVTLKAVSFIHSFIHSTIHSISHSLTHSSTHLLSLPRLITRSLACLLT